jgi:hypothetical protein
MRLLPSRLRPCRWLSCKQRTNRRPRKSAAERIVAQALPMRGLLQDRFFFTLNHKQAEFAKSCDLLQDLFLYAKSQTS